MNPALTESHLESPSKAEKYPDVCAVIVTYNPQSSFEQNVRALLPQVRRLIIVDNKSASAGHSLINRVATACEVEVIWNQQNMGIAVGLNAGIERILSNGPCSWIATFDQDSCAPSDYIASIFEAYSACPFRDEVAIVGATYTYSTPKRGDGSSLSPSAFVFREIRSSMTSGSLLKTGVFGICGRYDESLFMDYVDHEFCLRVRKHGFRIIQAGNALLMHQLGAPSFHRILGKRVRSSNHSPGRRYHNARNRLLVYRRYMSSEIWWIVVDLFGWFREMVKVVLFEHNRVEKLVNTAKGAWDAMKAPSTAREIPR